MGQGTQTEKEKEQEQEQEQEQKTETSTFPGQGQPGKGPGQLNQEPQHQSEHGLQPIPNRKEDNEKQSDPVEQSEQNKRPRVPDDTGAEQ